jgi:(2Fe-2S) ferredoxin
MAWDPMAPKMANYRRHLLVCTGPNCTQDGMNGAALLQLGQKLVGAGLLLEGPNCIKPTRVNCLGACHSGPILCVQPDGCWYHHVTPERLDRIIAEHLLRGSPVTECLFHQGPTGGS